MKKLILFFSVLLGSAGAIGATSQTGNLDYNNGGVLPKNYIKFGNATTASDLAKWVKYKDAGGVLPVDCTGGTPTAITWTRLASGGLRDGKNFVLTKGATNGQGEGVSYLVTLDPADMGKGFTYEEDYSIASGTYASDSIAGTADQVVAFYDVTNSKLLSPVSSNIIEGSSGKETKRMTVFPDANTTQIRVCRHTASTSAVAYALNETNFRFYRGTYAGAPIVTPWKSFTGNITGSGGGTYTPGTAGVIVQEYRQVGDTYEVRINVKTGTSGFGGYTGAAMFPIPAGLAMNEDNWQVLGVCEGTVRSTGAPAFRGSAKRYDALNAILCDSSDTGLLSAGSSLDGADRQVSVRVSFKVIGAGGTNISSSEYDGRAINLTATSGSIATTVNTPIIFGTVTKDSTGTYNAATGRYTIGSGGDYTVSGSTNSSVGGALSVFINGVVGPVCGSTQSASFLPYVCSVPNLKYGDIIDVRPVNATTTFTSGSTLIITKSVGATNVVTDSNIYSKVNPGPNDLIWGTISQASASSCAVVSGKGFTVSCSSDGVVVVNFSTPRSTTPVCVGALASNLNSITCRANSFGTTAFNHTCANTSGVGQNVDRTFVCFNPN